MSGHISGYGRFHCTYTCIQKNNCKKVNIICTNLEKFWNYFRIFMIWTWFGFPTFSRRPCHSITTSTLHCRNGKRKRMFQNGWTKIYNRSMRLKTECQIDHQCLCSKTSNLSCIAESGDQCRSAKIKNRGVCINIYNEVTISKQATVVTVTNS